MRWTTQTLTWLPAGGIMTIEVGLGFGGMFASSQRLGRQQRQTQPWQATEVLRVECQQGVLVFDRLGGDPQIVVTRAG